MMASAYAFSLTINCFCPVFPLFFSHFLQCHVNTTNKSYSSHCDYWVQEFWNLPPELEFFVARLFHAIVPIDQRHDPPTSLTASTGQDLKKALDHHPKSSPYKAHDGEKHTRQASSNDLKPEGHHHKLERSTSSKSHRHKDKDTEQHDEHTEPKAPKRTSSKKLSPRKDSDSEDNEDQDDQEKGVKSPKSVRSGLVCFGCWELIGEVLFLFVTAETQTLETNCTLVERILHPGELCGFGRETLQNCRHHRLLELHGQTLRRR